MLKLALIIFANRADQEQCDLYLQNWYQHKLPIFFFTLESQPITIDEKKNPPPSVPIQIIKYEKNTVEILDALANDDQLNTFDAYLFYSLPTASLDPEKWVHYLQNSQEYKWLTASSNTNQPIPLVGVVNNAKKSIVMINSIAVKIMAKTLQQSNQQFESESFQNLILFILSQTKIPVLHLEISRKIITAENLELVNKGIQQGALLLVDIANPSIWSNALISYQKLSSSSSSSSSDNLTKNHKNDVMVGEPEKKTAVVAGETLFLKKNNNHQKNSSTITFVTALFDVRSREPPIAENMIKPGEAKIKTAEDYLLLAEQSILQWDINLVIITEPQFVKRIQNCRDKYERTAQTFIYPLLMEHSKYYSLIQKLQNLYDKKSIPANYWPPKDSPLYVWCMMQKAESLEIALSLNIFNSNKFYWIDMGIAHIAQLNDRYLWLQQLEQSDHDKLRMIQLRKFVNDDETKDAKQFYSRLQQCFAGGFFGGAMMTMNWFIKMWDQEIRESILLYPVFDQAMFGRIYQRNPEKFLPITNFVDGHRQILQPRPSSSESLLSQSSNNNNNNDNMETVYALLSEEMNPTPKILNQWFESACELFQKTKQSRYHQTAVQIAQSISERSEQMKQFLKLPFQNPNSNHLNNIIRLHNTSFISISNLLSEVETLCQVYATHPEIVLKKKKTIELWLQQLSSINNVVWEDPKIISIINQLLFLASWLNIKIHNDNDNNNNITIPVWVINLNWRTDRWKTQQRELQLINFSSYGPIRRFPAVDKTNKEDLQYITTLPFYPKMKTLPPSSICCGASHYKIWCEWGEIKKENDANDNEDQWLQVLEDDASSSNCTREYMQNIKPLLPLLDKLNIHFIWNGYHLNIRERWKHLSTNEPLKLIPLKENAAAMGIGGTFAYLVSKKGARIAKQVMDQQYNQPENKAIDEYFMRYTFDKINHWSFEKPAFFSTYYIPGDPSTYDSDIAVIPDKK